MTLTGFTDQSKNVQNRVVVTPTPTPIVTPTPTPIVTPTPTPTPCDPNTEDEPADVRLAKDLSLYLIQMIQQHHHYSNGEENIDRGKFRPYSCCCLLDLQLLQSHYQSSDLTSIVLDYYPYCQILVCRQRTLA